MCVERACSMLISAHRVHVIRFVACCTHLLLPLDERLECRGEHTVWQARDCSQRSAGFASFVLSSAGLGEKREEKHSNSLDRHRARHTKHAIDALRNVARPSSHLRSLKCLPNILSQPQSRAVSSIRRLNAEKLCEHSLSAVTFFVTPENRLQLCGCFPGPHLPSCSVPAEEGLKLGYPGMLVLVNCEDLLTLLADAVDLLVTVPVALHALASRAPGSVEGREIGRAHV